MAMARETALTRGRVAPSARRPEAPLLIIFEEEFTSVISELSKNLSFTVYKSQFKFQLVKLSLPIDIPVVSGCICDREHIPHTGGVYTMKRLSLGLAATAMMLGGLMTDAYISDAQAEMRTLRFAEFGPNRGTRASALEWLDEQMRERSNGELGLDIIWGGALLSAKDAAQGLSDGVADFASIVPVYAPGRLVVYEAADTTQYPDEWVGMMATYEMMTTHPAAIKEANDYNLHYFGNYTTGPTQILSREKPVKSLDDLEGMTIRATGSFVPAMEKHGAATVSVSQPKVYESLSNGSVDGSTTYYYVVKAYKQYEVAKYMTEVNMGQTLGFGIAMNLGTYESLSDEHKKLIDTLGKEFTEHVAEKMYRSRTDTKKELAQGIDGNKVEMIDAPEEMRQALIDIAEADSGRWVEKAEKKGLDGKKIAADFAALIEKYKEKQSAEGYPWDK